MNKNKLKKHVYAAGIAFDLLVYLPVFISNLAGIFSKSLFREKSLFFPAIVIIDVVMSVHYYSNIKDSEYQGEKTLYFVLLSILSASLIGLVISYMYWILCLLSFNCLICGIIILNEMLLRRMSEVLASLEKTENGYIAIFKRQWENAVEEVWSALTENNKLQQWMPNLEVVDLRTNGTMKFNMNDGTGEFFEITILDCKENSYWQFEWGEGSVRFELKPAEDECVVLLKEYIPVLNNHIAKDLAGWQICLEMLHEVLKGRQMEFPKQSWEAYYEEYQKIVHPLLDDRE
ncbi:SRPBCC family protein [Oceanobacillus jeddahense]|uniref:SRPBCC family protein n=1 Tax=Oceanobacillus jeddahense TaxID=1462527 RepID=A0ABY5JYQ0_9BACI|nr:SRPBCC family protein [Oceanobacillus jeddahense]UUI03967.1 SRPBCC family protein [Oceanobacillus jeddahense]